MKYATRCFTVCLTLMVACFCKPTAADLVLSFSDDTNGNLASFANSFDVRVGEPLTIGIYLQQTGLENVLSEDGIISFGLKLSSEPTGLGTISDLSANSGFEASRNEPTATGFEWEYGVDGSEGIKATSTDNFIRLGTFQFNSTAEGVSTFAVEDLLPGSGIGSASWFTSSAIGDLVDLDEEIFGNGATNTFQFSINATPTAVPEPSAFVLLSCIAGLAIGKRRRIALPFQAS